MKYRIVCFGDSNTWGYNPETGSRYDDDVRWTGRLQNLLGAAYTVVEEGQNGRTIAIDDPAEGEKNGSKTIVPIMESQNPFDLLIIMLGTNDMKRKFSYVSMEIAGEMEQFLEKVRCFMKYHMANDPKILLVAPPYVGENIRNSWLGDSFGYEEAIEKSKGMAEWYRKLADMFECDFIDMAQYVKASECDSIHLTAQGHEIVAEKLYEYIMQQGN